MADVLSSIATQLEYLGYNAVIEDGILKATHAERPHFWVFVVGQGLLFRSLFQIGPAASANPTEFLSFLNRVNANCIVSRFCVKQGFLSIEAWFPNWYDKKAFDSFFARYLADIAWPLTNETASIRIFFPVSVPPLKG
jgi:hypothetical protein